MSDRIWDRTSTPRSGSHGPVVPAYRIQCGHCREVDFVAGSESSPYAAITRKFEKAGWTVARRSQDDRCPECSRAAKRGAPANGSKDERLPMLKSSQIIALTKTPVAAPDAALVPPSPAVRAQLADLYMHLDEHFDVAAKAYKAGWSDAKIAAELGMAEAAVAKRREADYGPIEVDTLLKDLGDLFGTVRKRMDRFAAVGAEARHVADKAAVVHSDLVQSVKDLEASLNAILMRLAKAAGEGTRG